MTERASVDRRVDDVLAVFLARLAEADVDDVESVLVAACQVCLEPASLALFRLEETSDVIRLVEQRGLSAEASARLARLAISEEEVLDRMVASREVCATGNRRRLLDRGLADPVGSELVVPLSCRQRLLGVLVLSFERSPAIGSEGCARLRTFGRVAGLALGEARARTDAASAVVRLARLRQVDARVLDAFSILPEEQLQAAVRRGFHIWPEEFESAVQEFIQNVVQTIADAARHLVDAELAAVGIGDEPDRPFAVWAFSGMPDGVANAIGHNPRPVGTLGVVAFTGEPLRVADVRKHESFRSLPAGHPQVKSFLGVPITYRGKPLGNLYAANRKDAAEFSVDDQLALEGLASQAALALQQGFLQASVEAQRAQTQSLLDSVPNGILFIEAGTHNVMANPCAMKLFGMSVTTARGPEQYLGTLTYPDGRPVRFDELPSTRALQGEDNICEQLVITRHDGSQTTIMTTAAPVRGFGRKLLGAVVNFEDVSAVLDVERLRNLERVREQLNATIAHDIRNPIQTLLAQIQALLKHGVTEDVLVPTKALRRLERSSQALARISDVLLDVGRVERTRIEAAWADAPNDANDADRSARRS